MISGAPRRWNVLALGLLVGLPLIVVSLLGLRVVQARHGLHYLQQSEVAQLQTQQLLQALETETNALTQQWQAQVNQVATPYIENLRNLTTAGNGLRLIVVYDKQQQRLFPAEELLANTFGERLLLQEYLVLFASQLSRLPQDDNRFHWLPAGRSTPAGCWYDNNRYYCLVYNADALVSVWQQRLENELKIPSGGRLLDFRIIDPQGQTRWQSTVVAAPAISSRPLPAPLQSWRLEALAHSPQRLIDSQALIVFAIVLPLAVTLAGLAWQLQRSQRQHLQAKQQRLDFSRQLSHDFRTPLANLRLYSELLAQESGNNARMRDYCDVIESEAQRLDSLVENALAITDNSERHPQLQTAVPDHSVQRIAARYQPLLQRSSCTLQLRPQADKACHFDLMAWERIIINLLDNACKYAPGSLIELDTVQQASRLQLSVRDHGAASANNPSTPGFRIGLEACRQMALQNRGDILIKPANPGLKVTVWLRTAAALTAEDQG